MVFANAVTMLLSALAPAVVLIALGVALSLHRRLRGAISATALATGLALLVSMALVAGVTGLDALGGWADSEGLLLGLPFAVFVLTLGVFARRDRLSAWRVVACGAVGVAGLWWLGGLVVMLTACGINPHGGC